MPTLTYPGVYIEELPSGVHAITGVATSIAAFIGWAPQGPATEAAFVESWSEYEALFGGLDARSLLGYSVNQFFANGGQQAYIVRLVWDGTLLASPTSISPPVPCATAVAAGVGFPTALIAAALGSISGSAPLNVGPPVLQSMIIAPANLPFMPVYPFLPPIPMNASISLSAIGIFSDGSHSPQNPVPALTWSSGNTGVVSITKFGGVATGVGAGMAVLTATSGLISATIAVTVSAVPLAASNQIVITPSPISSLAAGQTQQLSATANYLDGTTQDVTAIASWTSSNSAEATVSNSSRTTGAGLVTGGLTTGTATITASCFTVSGTASVTVKAAVISGITLYPANPTVQFVAGPPQTISFTAMATHSDGSIPAAPAGGTASWISSNPAVAIVDASGNATIVATGSTTITLTYTSTTSTESVSASATLTVTNAALNAILVTPIKPSVPVWNPALVPLQSSFQLQLRALGIYSDGTTVDLTHSVHWTSANTAEALVDLNTGIVTGVPATPPGTLVTITATVPWQTTTHNTVSVTIAPAELVSIALTGFPATPLHSGQTVQLTATPTYSDGLSTPAVTAVWSSSAPAVATISNTGLATVKAAGGSLTLFAKNPGVWGNSLRVTITPQTSDPTRFGLLVQQVTPSGQLRTLESFVSLSVVATDPLFAVTVIDNDSKYISFINPATNAPVVPAAAPSPTPPLVPIALSGGADGSVLVPASDQNFEIVLQSSTRGLALLDRVHIFNLLCVPAETDALAIQALQTYCAAHRAFHVVDAPQLATTASLRQSGPVGSTPGSITGAGSANSAYYYPWVLAPDPLFGNRPTLYPPCGFVAGIYAATDANRGVWKAPAGIGAAMTGVSGLQYNLTDLENGDLNIQAINCLRQFKVYGDVVWGSRTLQGNDQAGSEWKYVPIRRLALFLESSLYEGTQWIVFEPNDAPLWSQIRLNVGAFMQGLFLQGAFQGTTPRQAYFVKCDAENNPQASIDLGIVNILVGFAPLYPAEFVVIQIQQIAGQVA